MRGFSNRPTTAHTRADLIRQQQQNSNSALATSGAIAAPGDHLSYPNNVDSALSSGVNGLQTEGGNNDHADSLDDSTHADAHAPYRGAQ